MHTFHLPSNPATTGLHPDQVGVGHLPGQGVKSPSPLTGGLLANSLQDRLAVLPAGDTDDDPGVVGQGGGPGGKQNQGEGNGSLHTSMSTMCSSSPSRSSTGSITRRAPTAAPRFIPSVWRRVRISPGRRSTTT